MTSKTRFPIRGEYVGANQRQIADVFPRKDATPGHWNVECVVEGGIVGVVIEWSNINNRWERVGR